MTSDELKNKTKNLGISVIQLLCQIPNNPAGRAIANQLVRSATSVGANYRAACRAKSNADFLYKLKIVEEETDETIILAGGDARKKHDGRREISHIEKGNK